MLSPRFTLAHKIAFLAVLLGGVSLAIILQDRARPADPIPVRLPENARPEKLIETPQATFMLGDEYVFRQDDRRWSRETIGETEDTLSEYGCTIASVAMAASNLTQNEITPMELERRLTEADCFTNRGWLIWDKVSEATDGKVSARYYDAPDHRDIKSCLAAGNYPVVKIKLYESIIHWVAIVGTTKDQYLIRDPLVGSAEDAPIELSERSQDIFGVRCIYKN